ncbi:MAG: hypothetical protein IJS17_03550 [Clostridia bacterium]|nr:hypothetical protein [Clostridia bacterium]
MSTGNYDDIIDRPHHVSERHPQLSKASYAAQFSPFAALTGYDGIVSEAARLTDERVELGETEMCILSAKLQILGDHIKEQPEVELTYFKKDKKKSGGAYLQKTACIKRIDDVERIIYFTDDTNLPIDDITDMRGEIFGVLESAEYET